MARAWSSSLLLVVLLAVAATAVAGARVPLAAAVDGNGTSVELRVRRGRRRATENGLGKTPQMGYVRYSAVELLLLVSLPGAFR
jgi:alpha-galactosidase